MFCDQNALYVLVVVMAHVVASPPDQAKNHNFYEIYLFKTLVVYQVATIGGSNFNQPFVENKAAEQDHMFHSHIRYMLTLVFIQQQLKSWLLDEKCVQHLKYIKETSVYQSGMKWHIYVTACA